MSALIACAPRSAACMPARVPFFLPVGERTAPMMYASLLMENSSGCSRKCLVGSERKRAPAHERLHAAGVEASIAPGSLQRPGTLHVEMQIQLPRVSHCAVHLYCRSGGQLSRIPGGELRVRGGGGGARVFIRGARRGRVHHRTGKFEFHSHARQVVLDRLVGADRLAELHTFPGIVGGKRQHALRDTQALGGAEDGAAIQESRAERPCTCPAREDLTG